MSSGKERGMVGMTGEQDELAFAGILGNRACSGSPATGIHVHERVVEQERRLGPGQRRLGESQPERERGNVAGSLRKQLVFEFGTAGTDEPLRAERIG